MLHIKSNFKNTLEYTALGHKIKQQKDDKQGKEKIKRELSTNTTRAS